MDVCCRPSILTDRKPDSIVLCLSRLELCSAVYVIAIASRTEHLERGKMVANLGTPFTCLTRLALVGKNIEAHRGPEHLESPLALRISAGLKSDDLRLEELVWLCRTCSVDQSIVSVHCGPPWQTRRVLVRGSIRESIRGGFASRSTRARTAFSGNYWFPTSLRMSFLAASHENITSTILHAISSVFGARKE